MDKEKWNWQFDFKIFDQYVQLAIDAGIDKAITIYTQFRGETVSL